MPPRFVAQQLSHPTGLVGSLMGRLMNRHNARLNAFALEQLTLGPQERLLEIGFGGGVMLEALLDRAGYVAGVDRSRVMVERARTRFRSAVESGRAEFLEGTVEAMPLATGAFDKAVTVNTIYFWPSLELAFREIARVLRPGGRLVVGFLPKVHMDRMKMPADIFTPRTPEEVSAALQGTGFRAVHIERPAPTTAWNVLIAIR